MRPSRAALALNLALATVAILLAVSAPNSSAGPAFRLAAADGTLTIANSNDGVAIFSAGAMRPGQAAGGTVRVANTGTVPAALQLARTAGAVDVPGPGGGRLSTRLELRVLDVTNAQAPVTVYGGRWEAMPSTALGTVAPGEQRAYEFVATLPTAGAADNAYQGARLAGGFTWTAVGLEAATPSPTPTPTPTPTPEPTVQTPSDTIEQPSQTGPTPTAASPPPPAPPPGPPAAADLTGAVLGAQVFSLPASGRCVSRRTFSIHIRRPRGVAFGSVTVSVNGSTKVELTGLKARRIKAKVNLRGLPKGNAVVKVVAVTTTGRRAVATRTYRTCAPKRR